MTGKAVACSDVRTLMPEYLTDELELGLYQAVRAHLSACESCAAFHETERELDRRLSLAFQAAVDTSHLDTRIRAHLEDKRVQMFWRSFLVAAASLVIVFAGTVAGVKGLDIYKAHLVCRDAVEDHQEEVVGGAPRRWVSDPAAINRLSLRVVPQAVLPQHGGTFVLKRARVCELNNRKFIHAVYSIDDQEFSVFLSTSTQKMISNTGKAFELIHTEFINGTSVAEYRSPQYVLVVSGNKPMPQLMTASTQLIAGM